MSTRVIVDPASISGTRALEAVSAVLDARAAMTRLAEALYAAIYTGGQPDIAAIEAELGVPAGKASRPST